MENGKWAAKHELLFWPKARACSYLHGPVSQTYPQLYLVSKYIFHQNSSLARLRRRWCLLAPGCVCVASLAEIAMTANQLCSNRSGFLSYFPVWPKWISTFCLLTDFIQKLTGKWSQFVSHHHSWLGLFGLA